MKGNQMILVCMIALLLIGTSCEGDRLTREKAASLVKDFYAYPNVGIYRYQLTLLGANRFRPLYNQGLLGKAPPFAIAVPVTSKGVVYIPSQQKPGELQDRVDFATCIQQFNEVTGIVFMNENKMQAKIEFNVKRTKITPFGEFLGYQVGSLGDFSVEAAKYDDGWRITTEPSPNYKSVDFPGVEEFIELSDKETTRLRGIRENMTYESGNSLCLIKEVVNIQGIRFLVVDYIQTELVVLDEFPWEEIKIKNVNPKLRTFKLPANANIRTELYHKPIPIESLQANTDSARYFESWKIAVQHGVVSTLESVYTP